MTERTQVAIIGAGPAGLVLGCLLDLNGVDSTILELRDRGYVEQRIRAGLLEHTTVELLDWLGAGERLQREGFRHTSFEVRFGGERHHIPMAQLTDGRTTWMYGQQKVVQDLIALREDKGGPLRFEASDIRIEGLEDTHQTIRYRHNGIEETLTCNAVAGCDGFHGISRSFIPDGTLQLFSRSYPFAWLGILADAPPATTGELIYAHHPNGFALHTFRSNQVSRLYLQVRPDEDANQWTDPRIWEELRTRFATEDSWKLNEGPVTQKNVTPMRSFVTEPMQYGNLFLVGDAAHIVPPTAAKGLNLAVADTYLLADALAKFFQTNNRAALNRYSQTALRRVWRVQEFSRDMTSLLHHDPSDAFDSRLQEAKLKRVFTSPSATTSFCEDYAGLPLESAGEPASVLSRWEAS